MSLSKAIAYFFSIIGHPMLLIMYMLFLYLKVNPYLFPYAAGRDLMTMVLIIFFTAVLLPGIGIMLLVGVGFIKSLEMEDRMERIGPLIIISISYLWLYLNIRTHNMIPIPYSQFVLGALIAVFFAFVVNVASKVSLHAVGIGGFVLGTILLLIHHGGEYTSLYIGSQQYNIHAMMILCVVIILGGIVLTSRLYLKAHWPKDIYGGFVIGAFGQMLAYTFF